MQNKHTSSFSSFGSGVKFSARSVKFWPNTNPPELKVWKLSARLVKFSPNTKLERVSGFGGELQFPSDFPSSRKKISNSFNTLWTNWNPRAQCIQRVGGFLTTGICFRLYRITYLDSLRGRIRFVVAFAESSFWRARLYRFLTTSV